MGKSVQMVKGTETSLQQHALCLHTQNCHAFFGKTVGLNYWPKLLQIFMNGVIFVNDIHGNQAYCREFKDDTWSHVCAKNCQDSVVLLLPMVPSKQLSPAVREIRAGSTGPVGPVFTGPLLGQNISWSQHP